MNSLIEIKSNEQLGRYLVTAQDLSAGQLLIEEIPFAFGPKPDSQCVCLECYTFLDGAIGSRCEKCSWPLCENCKEGVIISHKKECVIFREAQSKFQNLSNSDEVCTQLDCITPLRVLLAKEENQKRWTKEVDVMEHHEKFRKGTVSWRADENNVAKYLVGPCKMTQKKCTVGLVQKVLGILEVNVFEARTKVGNAIRCLYPILGITAHACVPNTTHAIHSSIGFKIFARTTVDLKQGDILYTSYTYTLNGTHARQAHLRLSKFFTCQCDRCLDPTELGTNMSTLLCQCGPGLIMSTNPIDPEATWKCNNDSCKMHIPGRKIQQQLQLIQNELDEFEEKQGEEKIKRLEVILLKYRKSLHPTHYIQIAIKNKLIDLYGHTQGYRMQDLSQELLARKIELCREVLSVLDIIEPGKTRSRALILYEIYSCIVLLARLQLGGKDLKLKLEEAYGYLKECANILEFEDEQSSEGRIYEHIYSITLDQLKSLIATVA